MDLQLTGKIVLITGASKGIGLAAAHSFAAEGCALHLAARSAPALAAAKAELGQRHGVAVTTHAMDLSSAEAMIELAGRAGDADILINNAGDIPAGPIDQLDDAAWRRAAASSSRCSAISRWPASFMPG